MNTTLDRRRLLAAGFALTPLAAALSACGRSENWAEGMRPIKWDRDPCAHCGMVISDRRFAAELCGAASNAFAKFDDVGCAVSWQNAKAKEQPWSADPATRLWVADMGSTSERLAWLDARAAHYVSMTSPMGFNLAASAQPQADAVDFQTMRERALARKE